MNILITAFFNLGDVILLTSALAWLKHYYPEVRITLLVRDNVRFVVENSPVVDKVIVANYQSKKSSIKEMMRLVRLIAAENFTAALLLESKLRSAIIVKFAGIPRRVGTDGLFSPIPKAVRFLCNEEVRPELPVDEVHQTESLVSIFKQFMSAPSSCNKKFRPVLPSVSSKAENGAENLLQRYFGKDNGKKKFAFCVKGTFALKNWPREYFAELISKLAVKYNADCFLVGVAGDREYAEKIAALADTPVVNLCGETGFFEMLALLQKSDLLVSVCTGTVHMASAVNTPTVAVYGCTPAKRWAPLSEMQDVCKVDTECCPCTFREHECPYGQKCLYDLKVDSVLEKVEKLLLTKDGV